MLMCMKYRFTCSTLTDNGRSESIEVLNAANGAVLYSPQTVSSFSGGEYLSWNLKGDVDFVITDVTGASAVVSGIFFAPDPPPAALPAAPANLVARATSASQVNLTWSAGFRRSQVRG